MSAGTRNAPGCGGAPSAGVGADNEAGSGVREDVPWLGARFGPGRDDGAGDAAGLPPGLSARLTSFRVTKHGTLCA